MNIPVPTPGDLLILDRRRKRLEQKLKKLHQKRQPLEVSLIAHLEREAELAEEIEETKLELLQAKEARKRHKPVSPAGEESWEGTELITKGAQYNLLELQYLIDDLPPRDAAIIRFSVSTRIRASWSDPVGPNFEVLKYAIPTT